MASLLQHILVGYGFNSQYTHYKDEDLDRYLLGCIAPDCPKKPSGINKNVNRIKTHFITENPKSSIDKLNRLEDRIPVVDDFFNKYGSKIDDPFVMGYFVHLITDKVFFDELVRNKTKDNLKDIDPKVNSYEELSQDKFLEWYRKNFYYSFDDDDLIITFLELSGKLPRFKYYLSPIDEVDNKDLQDLVVSINNKFDKLENISSKEKVIYMNNVVTMKDTINFSDAVVDTIYDYLKYKNINLNFNDDSKAM